MDEIPRVSSRLGSRSDEVTVIPLKTLKLRGAHYESKSPSHITLEYDRKSCRLSVNVQVEGKHGEPKETFALSRISGEALFLHTITGSLDDMVVKLLLETSSKVEVSSKDRVDYKKCGMIVATANVEETGRIRQLLMDLPSKRLLQDNNTLRLQEGIPQWSSYVPWWLYSKRLRLLIQQLIVLYTIFNTVWALWQLYRHVDFIQEFLEPYKTLLQETCHVYLSNAMDYIDNALNEFTNLWWKFLSPFKFLLGPLITPLYDSLQYLVPLLAGLTNNIIYIITLAGWLMWFLVYTLIRPIMLLITTIIRPILLLLATIVRPIVWLFWVIFTYIIRPLFEVIQRIPGLTKGGIDPVKALVRNILLNSFKSVYHVILWGTRFGRTYHSTHHRLSKDHKPARRNTANF